MPTAYSASEFDDDDLRSGDDDLRSKADDPRSGAEETSLPDAKTRPRAGESCARGEAPPRPLVWAALAVAFGAAGGLAAEPLAPWGLIALAGVLLASAAWVLGWAAAGGEPALGHAPAARARASALVAAERAEVA
ncbi:MAG: hypothetical protein IT453_02515, partial [Planctomycetes bacterium]|nr:hypothetical protein [Planctomycetota bacterium]